LKLERERFALLVPVRTFLGVERSWSFSWTSKIKTAHENGQVNVHALHDQRSETITKRSRSRFENERIPVLNSLNLKINIKSHHHSLIDITHL